MAFSTLIVDYLGEGLAVARPVAPPISPTALGFYLATDTGALSAWNGSAWTKVSGSTEPYVLAGYVPGLIGAPAYPLWSFAVPQAVTLPISLTGSLARCIVAPTGAVSLTIRRNGTGVGSINFAAAATSGTFTFASAVTLAATDILDVQPPGSADATFASVFWSLLGSRPT